MNFKNLIYLGLSILVVMGLTHCESSKLEEQSSQKSPYSTPPRFSEISQQILQSKCLSCHSTGTLDFSIYTTLMASGTITPNNSATSTFYSSVSTGSMPPGSQDLNSIDIQAIDDWIKAGALNE